MIRGELKAAVCNLRDNYGADIDSINLDSRVLLNIAQGFDSNFDFIPLFLNRVPVPISVFGVPVKFGEPGELFDPFIKFVAEDTEGFGKKEFRVKLHNDDTYTPKEQTTFTLT